MVLKELALKTLLTHPKIHTRTRTKTRRILIEAAVKLFSEGLFPSITEIAQQAELSRATAYRYFPTHDALVCTIVAETLKPVKQWKSCQTDISARIDDLLSYTFPHLFRNEGALRAEMHLALTKWGQAGRMPLQIKSIRLTLMIA